MEKQQAFAIYQQFLESPPSDLLRESLSKEHRARILASLTAWMAGGAYQKELGSYIARQPDKSENDFAKALIRTALRDVNNPIPSVAGLPSAQIPNVAITAEIKEAVVNTLAEATPAMAKLAQAHPTEVKQVSMAYGTVSNRFVFQSDERTIGPDDPDYLKTALEDAASYAHVSTRLRDIAAGRFDGATRK